MTETEDVPKAPRTPEGATVVLSGWCMTGHHRETTETVGCQKVFTSFVCPCPCHDAAADDSRYDSPVPNPITSPIEEI